MAQLKQAFSHEEIKHLTGKHVFTLFRDHYPRLKVIKPTVHMFRPVRGPDVPETEQNSIEASCRLCIGSFAVGQKVYAMPCSPLHVFHVFCFNGLLRAGEQTYEDLKRQTIEYWQQTDEVFNIDMVATDSIDFISCPICRRDVHLYESLTPTNRIGYTVARGNLVGTHMTTCFAALSSEELRIADAHQYIPWGNFRRYISAIGNLELKATAIAPPKYEISQVLRFDDPDNPQPSHCLRTNRGRLCELPSLKTLNAIIEGDGVENLKRWGVLYRLMELFLLSDIVNVLYIREKAFIHVYLQMRVNCGEASWFGYREFRGYVLRSLRGAITPIIFNREMRKFSRACQEHGFEKLARLYSLGCEIERFDVKVAEIHKQPRDDDMTRRIQDLRSIYGQANEEWRRENQSEPRLESQDESHELSAVPEPTPAPE